jgi:hypothetical protein
MKKALSEYILCLLNCLNQTKQANDRQLYERYIADAGAILASLEVGIDSNELIQKVEIHERLLVNTWITDSDNYKTFYQAWNKFKKLL